MGQTRYTEFMTLPIKVAASWNANVMMASGRRYIVYLMLRASPSSQSRRLCEVHAKTVAPTLVAMGHLGRSEAEMFLYIPLIDLGAEDSPLDESRDMLVRKADFEAAKRA